MAESGEYPALVYCGSLHRRSRSLHHPRLRLWG